MKKILHVDDVQRFRDLVKMELQGTYTVISLDDPDRVLEATAKQQPDLVILDHLMPSESDDTGFEICQQLRNSHADLPIVVFTGAWDGVAQPDEVEETWGAKVIFKSQGASALKTAVDDLLSNR